MPGPHFKTAVRGAEPPYDATNEGSQRGDGYRVEGGGGEQ